MSEKIGRSTCNVCHAIKERTEMFQHAFYEETGTSSGVSFSTNPSRNKSTRIGMSERTYKRKKKVWICNACWAQRPLWLITFLKMLFFSPIYPLIYKGYSKTGAIFGSIMYFIFGFAWLFGLVEVGLEGSDILKYSLEATLNEYIQEDWLRPIIGILVGPIFFVEWGGLIQIIIVAIALFYGWVSPIAMALFGNRRNQQGLPNSRLF